MPNCRDCSKEILWLKHHQTGKVAPIEAEKHPDGNLVISVEKGLYRFANDSEYEKHKTSDTGPKLWISHFVQCPNAKEFRRK
jgi:hypothetical protein